MSTRTSASRCSERNNGVRRFSKVPRNIEDDYHVVPSLVILHVMVADYLSLQDTPCLPHHVTKMIIR
jgi:hypothetical protein